MTPCVPTYDTHSSARPSNQCHLHFFPVQKRNCFLRFCAWFVWHSMPHAMGLSFTFHFFQLPLSPSSVGAHKFLGQIEFNTTTTLTTTAKRERKHSQTFGMKVNPFVRPSVRCVCFDAACLLSGEWKSSRSNQRDGTFVYTLSYTKALNFAFNRLVLLLFLFSDESKRQWIFPSIAACALDGWESSATHSGEDPLLYSSQWHSNIQKSSEYKKKIINNFASRCQWTALFTFTLPSAWEIECKEAERERTIRERGKSKIATKWKVIRFSLCFL